MSDTAHTIPGQSILERLYSRGTLRPRIGASASFYERFGLTDPWDDERLWSDRESEGEGEFFFLSAAPYYRRLRSRRQREWRARRRLLMRLSTSAHRLHGRSIDRLTQPGPATGAWLSLRRPALALSVESAMVMLPPVPEVAPEAEPRERWSRFRDREREERTREAPMARAMRQVARPVAAVPAALEEVISIASRHQRRTLRRIIEEVAVLPAEEQVVVARQVTRQLRGPGARAARADVEQAAEETGRSPVAVASSRASVRRSKGLRPVLTSSPALSTLTFEEPTPIAEAAPVARRRVVRVATPTAYREVPQAEVVREVRTQRVTGRAGPAVAEAAAASARPRRRPTEWAATLAQGNERSATRGDSSYGLRSVEPMVRRRPRGVARVAARSVAVPAVGTRGEALVAPSPTAFLKPRRPTPPPTTRVVRMAPDALPVEEPSTASTRRVLERATVVPRVGRRSRLVAASPTAYVTPIEVEERVAEVRPPRRRVRRAVPPVEEAIRREKPPREAAPQRVVAPRAVVLPVEEELEERARALPLTQRAVARSVEAPRRDDRGDLLLSAAPVVRRIAAPEPELVPERPTAPMWRAATRGEEPRRRVRALRLAVAPMAHVAPIEEPVPQEAAPAAPRRRARRPVAPTVRAAQRSEISEPAPEPSRVALARAPTSYLRAPVEEPKRRIAPPAEPEEQRSRSTVRAAARAMVAPRTDARGAAQLTSGATDYLQVAASADAEGPLSRSPVAPRVRRMRRPVIDTETVVRPVEPVAAEPVPERPVRRRAPAARPTSTARAADRLDVARREEPYAAAPRAPAPVRVAATEEPSAPARERILVRDARGRVRPMTRVASGAAAYASARLVTTAPMGEPIEETPLRRATVARPHAARRPMPHTVVRDDFRWLVPEPAPRVRVEGERRVTAAGPVSRERLRDVLSQVTAVVRAVQRADDARVIVPATRRTLEGARVVVERVRMRRAPTVSGEVLLRVILPEEVTPVERAERRGAVPAARQVPTPSARPLRRAFAGAEGFAEEAVDRVVSRAQPAPTGRRTAARTLRTSDGRYAPSPARRRMAPEEVVGFGLGEPGLPRRRARVEPVSGVLLPQWEDEAVPTETGRPRRARPLQKTLEYMGEEAPPEPRRGEVVPPRRARPMRRAAPPEALLAPLGTEDEEAPAWAHRAVHGTSLRRAPEEEVVAEPTRRGSSGSLFNALARARSPEDVVQVILERGGGIGAAARELPEPAIRLVQRIVRIQEGVAAEARYIEHPSRETLAPRRKRRTSASTPAAQFSTLAKSSPAPTAAARQRVTSLTQKLMKLIHLAEVERRVTEAQREVRMAPEGAEAAAGGGGREAGGEAGAPNLKKLESDVLAAVIQELDLMKLRRQEDFNDVWW